MAAATVVGVGREDDKDDEEAEEQTDEDLVPLREGGSVMAVDLVDGEVNIEDESSVELVVLVDDPPPPPCGVPVLEARSRIGSLIDCRDGGRVAPRMGCCC